MQGDRVSSQILRLLSSSNAPLETKEIVDKIVRETKTTRTILFKRLTDLRGDQALFGKRVGSGKGVWIWWSLDLFSTPAAAVPPSKDRVANAIRQTVNQSPSPLETTEVARLVRNAIPATRTILFKRLTDLRGDSALKGKHVGSGKGTWIWWREHA